MYYKDKVAIVTGGASGIGKALSNELARRGAIVVIADINLEAAIHTADEIMQLGYQAEAYQLDVADNLSFESVIQSVYAKFKKIDLLFNNAGILVLGEAKNIEVNEWKRIISINLLGVIYGSQAAYKIMIQQGFGQIINSASSAGLIPAALWIPYSVSKSGVISYSEGLRIEAKYHGIKVNTLCPGFIESNLYQSSHAVGVNSGQVKSIIPFSFMNTEKAVKKILNAVEKNKRMIIFPWYCHVFLWLYRFFPAALLSYSARLSKRVREV